MRIKLFKIIIIIIASIIFYIDCDNPRNNKYDLSSLKERFAIDGQIDFDNLSGYKIADRWFWDVINHQVSYNIKIKWIVLNDFENLYIAVEWEDTTYNTNTIPLTANHPFDLIQLVFDSNGDGSFGANEDIKLLVPVINSFLYSDAHKVSQANQDDTDDIQNGEGYICYYADTQIYQAEFLIPHTNDINNQDIDISTDTKFNILVYDQAEIDNNGNMISGNVAFLTAYENDNSSEWDTISAKK